MDKIILNEHSAKSVSYDPDVWNLKSFRKKLKIEIVKYDELNMEFDLICISPAFVNAFRRVLLAEVPSMAIEKVHVYNNTSIIQDEVLSHRLGLIPLKADHRKFSFKKSENESFSAEDTLEFSLKIKCTKDGKSDNFKNDKVFSKDFKWVPIGDQITKYKATDVGPIDNDILIAKLRPGHELDLKLFAFKGIGKDHAKFQPVATAWYRLLPEIVLLRDVVDEQAQRLKSCFSDGVIVLDKDKNNRLKARIADARYDSCSRNAFRYDDLKDCVKILRKSDHFIFTIESVGALPPDILFLESINVLRMKCDALLELHCKS